MVKRGRTKGGFFGLSELSGIASQAAVPFALVALNQSRSKKHGQSRSKKHGAVGGAGGAAGYVNRIAGSSTIGQLDRTFNGNQNGNALILTNGKSVGGSRRKGRKSKRGGQWSQILNQAVVPASILALQQSYRRRGSKNGKRTKRRYR